MEKVDFRDNLLQVTNHFGDAQLLPVRSVADFLGVDHRSLLKDKKCPIKKIGARYYLSVVGLARYMS